MQAIHTHMILHTVCPETKNINFFVVKSGNSDISNHSCNSFLHYNSHDPPISNIFLKVIKDADCRSELTVIYELTHNYTYYLEEIAYLIDQTMMTCSLSVRDTYQDQ